MRVHVPKNGNIFDVQIWLDEEIINLDKNASFSVERGDVYFAFRKTYEKVDPAEYMKILEQLRDASRQTRQSVFMDSADIKKEMLAQRKEKIRMHRVTRWLTLAWMLVLAIAIVFGVHYFEDAERWVRSFLNI